jgi:hypothetical protein
MRRGTHNGSANILTQASLRIGGNQPIQGLRSCWGPVAPYANF